LEELCSLPTVVGAIDGMHVSIAKSDILFGQDPQQVQNLLNILKSEGIEQELQNSTVPIAEVLSTNTDDILNDATCRKRQELGVHLSIRRRGC